MVHLAERHWRRQGKHVDQRRLGGLHRMVCWAPAVVVVVWSCRASLAGGGALEDTGGACTRRLQSAVG